jgi:hypothetical protein
MEDELKSLEEIGISDSDESLLTYSGINFQDVVNAIIKANCLSDYMKRKIPHEARKYLSKSSEDVFLREILDLKLSQYQRAVKRNSEQVPSIELAYLGLAQYVIDRKMKVLFPEGILINPVDFPEGI